MIDKKYILLKNLLLIIAVLMLVNKNQSQNVPNGGFEQWTKNGTIISEPYFWETQNEPGLNFVESTDGYNSQYAVKLKIVWDEVIKSFAGGTISTSERFAVSQRFDTLSCCFKGTISGNDSLIVSIKLFSNGQLVGYGSHFSVNASDRWKRMIVPVFYSRNVIPDKAYISISISPGHESHYQTTYSIDDILLTSINQINNQFKKRRKNETFQCFCNHFCS